MPKFEYKVVPAPSRGEKAKGIKGAEERFAHSIEMLMNEMAARGWEYQRAETLPSEERSGLTSSQTVWRNLLVFRRTLEAEKAPVLAPDPEQETAPVPVTTTEEPAPANAPAAPQSDAEAAEAQKAAAAQSLVIPSRFRADNGVEETDEVEGPSPMLTQRARRLRDDSTE